MLDQPKAGETQALSPLQKSVSLLSEERNICGFKSHFFVSKSACHSILQPDSPDKVLKGA
jgi:hypothetical protein